VSFVIRHLGVSKVRGRFQDFEVDVVVGPSLADTSVTATIQTASIDTGNTDRDAHVRTPDLLDVEKRPTMVFRSTSIAESRDGWIIDGELTIGDVTRPQRLDLEFGGVEEFPGGPRHAGFEATGELRRKEFGIDIAMPPGISAVALGDVIKIELDIQLLEPTPVAS
jgi:polyisoprenoid-binding protein YceI